jgi:site-specific recombinase XerD
VLDRYFIRPTTVDRIRSSWIGEAIERYVNWLTEQNYAARSIFIRVPLLIRFGESAQRAGATTLTDLPPHVEPFIRTWLGQSGKQYSEVQRVAAVRGLRGPIQQMLRLTAPQTDDSNPGVHDPFANMVPGFFEFLRRERGLRETTLVQYRHYLRRFEDYLRKVERPLLPNLPPSVVADFITESGEGIDARSVQSLCSILKVFFRYLYRASLMPRDLSKAIESPRRYRFANLPRSISWAEVERMLQSVDRRNAVGRRDYAVLLLLTTYGLRGREVAALTLDDIDWKHNRVHVGGRKADHSTAYPLTPTVGEAILDYLRNGRPETKQRAVFFEAYAPHKALSRVAVTMRAKHYLRKAGIQAFRPGSHTLRHACVQRLVDAGLSFKTIGDFVGHRTPDATKIYAKVNLKALREVALGDGEEVL